MVIAPSAENISDKRRALPGVASKLKEKLLSPSLTLPLRERGLSDLFLLLTFPPRPLPFKGGNLTGRKADQRKIALISKNYD
jgi:hypothetical protein